MATINIFGEIGYEVLASNVIEQIQNTKDEELNIIISSGGGSAFEGLMIYDALQAYKEGEKRVNTKILGLGASAASVIFMAGDHREMGEGSLLMVHNSWSSFTGNRQEVKEKLGTLEAIDNRMLNIFQKGTGLRAEDLEKLLADETWMTVDAACSYGFANTVGETISIAASIYDSYKQKHKEPVKMATEEETKQAGFFAHMAAWFNKDEAKSEAKAEDEEPKEEEEAKAESEDEGVEVEEEKEEAKAEGDKPEEEEAKAEDSEEDKEKEEMKAKISALETELAEAKASKDDELNAKSQETEVKSGLIFDAMSENKFTLHEAKQLASKPLDEVKAAIDATAVNASGGGKTERPEASSIDNKYDTWMSMKSEGKHTEAQAFYKENRNEILKDK